MAAVLLFSMSGICSAQSAGGASFDARTVAPASEIFGSPAIARDLSKDTSGKGGVKVAVPVPETEASGAAEMKFSRDRSLVGNQSSKVKEDVSKRTRNSRTFVRADGSVRVDQSRYSVNYFSGKEWLPIDTTLRADTSIAGFSYSMLANQFKVRLNHEAGKAAVSFAIGDQAVTYKPVGMKAVKGVVKQDTISYPEAWASTDLVYQVQDDELKMELLLRDAKAPKVFGFEIQTQGVQYRINADQSVDFLNADGQPVFKIPSFWVQDSSSPDRRYDRLEVSIVESRGKTVIQLKLNDEGLKYPIIVDPSTAAIYNTVSSGGSYYLYDNGGRLSQTVSLLGTVDYLYDLNGNLLRRTKSNNLLVNGSFELNTGTTGIADGWNPIYLTPQTVSSPVTSGQKAQKLTASNVMSGYYVGMSQRVRVDGGKPFIANASLNIEALSNATVYLYMDFMDSQNNWIGNSGDAYSGTTGSKYITMTTTGTVPANATYADVYIMVLANANYGSATLYVDQMNFRYDSEPNLLTNPGFEGYSGLGGTADGWIKLSSGSTPYIQVVNESVSEGLRSHKVFDSNIPSGAISGIYQNVKMSGNAAYNLSAVFDTVALTNTKVQLFIDFLNSQHQYIGNNVTENTLLVPNLALSLSGTTPPNTAYAIVYILLRSTGTGGTGTIFADMVNLKYTSAPNKVANGSFEVAGTDPKLAAGWQRAASIFDLVSSPVLSGRRAQKLAGSGIPNGYVVYVCQSIKVTPGALYSTSANVYVESLTNALVRLQINFFDVQGQVVGVNSMVSTTVGNSYDQIYLSNYTVPSNAVRANVLIVLQPIAASGSGTVYIDDVKFN
ncbi:hypothetical protein D3H35_13910 [Cohnella faecalis]|uniref:CBM-cenC domain-containing protein n=2 Tax=Cohnella faecalis TaxID=2315694 RepID=A0A398CHR8_9BACL|nr:hypothetical protein D3H35_13910 [Cohnella faecalis]